MFNRKLKLPNWPASKLGKSNHLEKAAVSAAFFQDHGRSDSSVVAHCLKD
jgi:hypothetical protein